MKKYAILCFLVLFIASSFISCDDDDNVSESDSVARFLSGTYEGSIAMDFMYASLVYEEQSVTLTAHGNNAVDVSFSDDALGSLEMSLVPIVRSDDGCYYILEAEGVLSMPYHEYGTADYACLFSGMVSEDKSEYVFVFSMPAVMGGTTYTLTPTYER